MNFIFVILMCTSNSCNFLTTGELMTEQNCKTKMNLYEQASNPDKTVFSVAACLKINTKEKTV
jgi:hypothetical protein